MKVSIVITVVLVSGCAGLDLDHNCSFRTDLFHNMVGWEYPKIGDMPLLNRKIISGRRVSILEHPYVASIRRQVAHYLTGTLVGGNLVLTAAHPLIDVPIIELSVVVGQNYNDRGSILFTVILIIVHKNFNPLTLSSDLAFLRVHEHFIYKPAVKTVANFYDPSFDLVNMSVSAFVTGWGRCDKVGRELCLPRASKYYKDEYSDPMLRSVHIGIIHNSVHCAAYRNHEVKLGDKVLCVGPARKDAHTSPCLGVPGAPLVVKGILLGVLSWGFGCGHHTDLPLIYSDVRAHYDWITRTIDAFTDLNADQFEQLYETTKTAIIADWFAATREESSEHEHKLEIQPWKIDKALALIDGVMYDIRDYFGGPEHHIEKMARYELLRLSIQEDPRSTVKVLAKYINFRPINSSDTEFVYDNDYDALEGNPYTQTTLKNNDSASPKMMMNIQDDDYF